MYMIRCPPRQAFLRPVNKNYADVIGTPASRDSFPIASFETSRRDGRHTQCTKVLLAMGSSLLSGGFDHQVLCELGCILVRCSFWLRTRSRLDQLPRTCCPLYTYSSSSKVALAGGTQLLTASARHICAVRAGRGRHADVLLPSDRASCQAQKGPRFPRRHPLLDPGFHCAFQFLSFVFSTECFCWYAILEGQKLEH